jgi:hypothetical protein
MYGGDSYMSIYSQQKKANIPIIKYDKLENHFKINCSKFTHDATNDNLTLFYKIYKINESPPSDYTSIPNLKINDDITLFNIDYNSEYIIESYILPDDTSINQSDITKIICETKENTCATSLAAYTYDPNTNQYTVICPNNCTPVYRSNKNGFLTDVIINSHLVTGKDYIFHTVNGTTFTWNLPSK